MRRRTFDIVASSLGAVLAVVLVVAGGLLMWGYSYANSNVHNQLAQQQIYFPPRGSPELANPKIAPYLDQYAGQQLLTGPQAEAWADHFIAVHLSEMPYGGVYSKVSAASMANPKDAKLAALVDTTFRGTTLRGLLLEAYGFWTFGQIALWGAIASFIFAAAAAILTALGFRHARRTPEDAQLWGGQTKSEPLVTAAA